MRLDPNDRTRLQWKAMPWALYTRCDSCGEQRHSRGREREVMVCLDCFTSDQSKAKAKRGGKPGPRSGYRYGKRRPKLETIALVRQLRARGVVKKEIADRLGISDRTVANYLSTAAPGFLPFRADSSPKNGSQSRSTTRESSPEKNYEGDPSTPSRDGA